MLHLQGDAGQFEERFLVLLRGLVNDILRERWGWRLFVPVEGLQVITDELLVEALLGTTRLV